MSIVSNLSKVTFALVWSALLVVSPVSGQANQSNPNGLNAEPERGWSLWKPDSEIEEADFDAGFSNMELGGYLDFQNACETDAGVPKSEIEYWFRLSNSVNRIGTGIVEHGCWVNGRFLHTYSSTAIQSSLENVDCLQVNSLTGTSLIIRSEPNVNSRALGSVRNGRRVRLDSFPANIIEVDGRNWVAIVSPKNGWISDGSPNSEGNLKLCPR